MKKWVLNHPWTTILIAYAVGAVLAYITGYVITGHHIWEVAV